MKLLWMSVFVFLFTGCNVINPDEQEPSFVFIDDFSLYSNTNQGTPTYAISDLWCYSNSDIRGIFTTPAQVPLLDRGSTKLTVYAGIKNNGIGSTRIRYPFYAKFDTILDLQPLQTYHIKPRFEYSSSAQVDVVRNFESGNFFVAGPNNQGSMELIVDGDIAVDGNKCGKYSLTSDQNYLHLIDGNQLQMQSGNTVFLEMDYSCNNTFALGVYTVVNGSTEKNPIIYLTPTTTDSGDNPTWNKIYIDFGPAASSYPNAISHSIYIESLSNETTTPTIYLDNMKIVNW
jgi:hypothetical protein